jgi:hypothetical protein
MYILFINNVSIAGAGGSEISKIVQKRKVTGSEEREKIERKKKKTIPLKEDTRFCIQSPRAAHALFL